MRYPGSCKVKMLCYKCNQNSPEFMAYLYESDGNLVWVADLPRGWTLNSGAALGEDNIILGGCPEHPHPLAFPYSREKHLAKIAGG